MLHIWSDNGKCFIAEWNGLPRRNEMKTGAASAVYALWAAPCQVWKGEYMKRTCGAWSTAAPYEAALPPSPRLRRTRRAMKRSLFRLHVFLPWNQGKKMVDHFRLIRNFLSSSNGCKLIKNAYRFVISRKYLCFCLFMQRRKIFYSTERTFSPKQTQNAPNNS